MTGYYERQRVVRKNWFTIFSVKVTTRVYMTVSIISVETAGLSVTKLGTASQARVSYGQIGLLHPRSKSEGSKCL